MQIRLTNEERAQEDVKFKLNERYEKRMKYCEKAREALKELYCDVEPAMFGSDDVIVEIHWGDWKHSHLRADWLMEQAGFEFCGENVTEEDGSDCYSAMRFYKFKEVL